MKQWTDSRWHLTTLAVFAAGCLALAPAAPAEDLTRVWAGPDGLDFEPLVEHGRLVLTVSGPDGFHHRAELESGETPAFSILDEAGGIVPDGSYTWELRAVPTDVRRRDASEVGPVAAGRRGGNGSLVQSGSFAVVDGVLVAGGETEPGAGSSGPGNVLASKDQVVVDDLIVIGSLCVGFDCVNGESFGFDTLRLKENNVRIQFNDTSSIGAFPTNNWQIRANASASGGASFLGFMDQGPGGSSETGTRVFAVEAGAPTNALYVDDSGRVGLGTATPVLDIHVVSGNTPSLRLEQDASGGFTPQTWDVAGNEASFFVRDATGGSRLPFRIEPGAPTNALYVDETGGVGLGTDTPAARLDVVGSIAVSGTVDGRDVSADGATLDAHVVDFNNPHQVTAAQLGIDEDATKAGVVAGAAFAGTPAATATVTFAEPFDPGTSFVVLLTAVTSDDQHTFTPNVLTKDETGFTVTLGPGPSADLVEVAWLARPVGE